jgi:hypothetical protein
MNTVPFVLNYAHTCDTTIYSLFNDVMSHIPSTQENKKRTVRCTAWTRFCTNTTGSLSSLSVSTVSLYTLLLHDDDDLCRPSLSTRAGHSPGPGPTHTRRKRSYDRDRVFQACIACMEYHTDIYKKDTTVFILHLTEKIQYSIDWTGETRASSRRTHST